MRPRAPMIDAPNTPPAESPRDVLASVRLRLRLARFVGTTAYYYAWWETGSRVVGDSRLERFRQYTKQSIAQSTLDLLGVDVRLRGELGPAPGPRLIVSNHRGGIDVGVLMALTGGTFLSRADIERWPLFGSLAKAGRTIFVDREDQRSGATAIRAMRRRLQVGETVVAFPEGRTFRGDEVLEFRRGAFAAARGLGATIIPVGLAYPAGTEYVDVSFSQHLGRVAARPKTPVGVAVGEPFPGEGSTRDMAAEAEKRVKALVPKARALCGEI